MTGAAAAAMMAEMNGGGCSAPPASTANAVQQDMAAALQLKLGDLPNKPPPKAGFSYASMARKAATDETRATVEEVLNAPSTAPYPEPMDEEGAAMDAAAAAQP